MDSPRACKACKEFYEDDKANFPLEHDICQDCVNTASSAALERWMKGGKEARIYSSEDIFFEVTQKLSKENLVDMIVEHVKQLNPGSAQANKFYQFLFERMDQYNPQSDDDMASLSNRDLLILKRRNESQPQIVNYPDRPSNGRRQEEGTEGLDEQG
jgi:hypothetical protein